MGLFQESFKIEIERLEEEKLQLEIRLKEIHGNNSSIVITEETILKLLSNFRKFVKERNSAECMKFIQHYVKKVIVYPDKVEAVYTVATLFKDDNEFQITSENKIAEDGRIAV